MKNSKHSQFQGTRRPFTMETVKADDTAKMGMCSSFFEIPLLEMYGTACSEENMMHYSQRRFGL